MNILKFIRDGVPTNEDERGLGIRQPEHAWENWWDHHPTTRYGSTVDHQQIAHNWWYGRHWHDQIFGGLTLYWGGPNPAKSYHDLNSPYSRRFNVALETFYNEQGYSFMWIFTLMFEMLIFAAMFLRKNANYLIAAFIVLGSSYWFTQDNAEKAALIAKQQVTLNSLQLKQNLDQVTIAAKASESHLKSQKIEELKIEKDQLAKEMQSLRESQNALSAAFLNLQASLVKENIQRNQSRVRTSFDHPSSPRR
jgi:hypothetical protein